MMEILGWILLELMMLACVWLASSWVITWRMCKRLRALDYDVKLITRFTGIVVHATHPTEKTIWLRYRWWRVAGR